MWCAESSQGNSSVLNIYTVGWGTSLKLLSDVALAA